MPQTNNRFLDDLARLMTGAAGAADGARREFETLLKAQGERMIGSMDLVQREEFEAVKAMAQRAREENEDLKARIAKLEAVLASRG
ncbi:MAG TPA: accessory factor UbiK family protein [Hyphomicrobiaceae bacterium]|nr:accessory factor UbiK family protein [Hyphomicrobiaceae bacterium]